MVACRHCTTLNSLDSTFCKRCGTGLPEDEILEARERLETVVAGGNSALNDGRLDEALAIAENAVASDPSMIAALSLKASCHERLGQLAEALECAERIVELNPDSDLDRIKRNQLRSNLMAHARAQAPAMDKRLALVGAAAVVVLVVSIGGIVQILNKRSSEYAALAANQRVSQVSPLAGQATTPNQPADRPNPGPTSPGVTAPEGGGPSAVEPGDVPPLGRSETEPRRQDGPLPRADNSPDAGSIGIRPFQVDPGVLPPATESNQSRTGDAKGNSEARPPSNPNPSRNDNDPAPDAMASNPGGGTTTQPENPGMIEITVHNGANPVAGGSESLGGSGLEALVRTGTQRFQLGNYAGAADNFERALRIGGDRITLNQRLGQCYERLGRNSDAVGAYSRALNACESALASGKGNRAAVEAKADTLRSAIKVLQGG